MFNLKENVKNNPTKHYLFVLIIITLFFLGFFVIVFILSAKPAIGVLAYYFNTTNVSTTFDFLSNTGSTVNQVEICYNNLSVNCTTNLPVKSNPLNFDSISTIIAILGSFGVLTYIFYSIKEGSFTEGDEKKIEYGFTGGFSIILFLIVVMIISLFYGLFPFDKLWEIIFLALVFALTLIIAVVFNEVFEAFEYNYQNRLNLIQFLEVRENQTIISKNWDIFGRWIIATKESISLYTFLLIIFLPVFGYFNGLNVLSIVFLEFIVFILFGGFNRLTRLFENICTIELKNQLEDSRPSQFLHHIFMLYDSHEGYIEILSPDNKKCRINKSLVYSMEYDKITIFKEKEKLLPPTLRTKRIIRFVLSLFITVIIYPFIILNILHSKDLSTWLLIISWSAIAVFCFIGLFSIKIDKWIDKIYYEYFMPTSTI